MYFGLSFSRIGCDFRPLLIPIFTKRVSANFQHSTQRATKNFENNIESYTLINKNHHHSGIPWKNRIEDENQPPESLLEFYPLADYLNNILGNSQGLHFIFWMMKIILTKLSLLLK